MATIYLENLPEEYRRKLCARELSRETIDRLAVSVNEKYLLRKRTFGRVAVGLLVLTILMAVLTLFAPAARRGNMAVEMGAFGFTLLVEIPILAAVYFLAVTRVPRQFAKCLKKGYPELEIEYGYEQICSGSFANGRGARSPSFSMQIEDVFPLKGSADIVAVGFAHGLIVRGNSAFTAGGDDPSEKRGCVIVSAVEKADGKPAVQAADCRVALRIRKGAELGLAPGMYLHRE